jgi:hypothetical protein
MDKQLQLQIQSKAHNVVATLRARVAGRAALRGGDPEIQPTRKETHDYDAASYRAYAAAFKPLQDQLAAARAAVPAPHRFRLDDPGAETRVSRLLDRTLSATPAGLARTYRELIPQALAGDEESFVALHELVQRDGPEDGRMAYSKNLLRDPREAAALSDAIVAAQQALAAHPAIAARAADVDWIENAEQEVGLLGKVIAAGGQPLDVLDAYFQTDSFPTILPKAADK